jgi:hypothetical protein
LAPLRNDGASFAQTNSGSPKQTAAGSAPAAVTKHRSRRLAKFKTITARPRYEADARYDVFFIFFFFAGFVGVVAMTFFLLSDDPSAGLSFKHAGLARSLGLSPLAGDDIATGELFLQ